MNSENVLSLVVALAGAGSVFGLWFVGQAVWHWVERHLQPDLSE
jgi:hypothetical protein